MVPTRRFNWFSAVFLAAGIYLAAGAQIGRVASDNLIDAVELDRADNAVVAQLERAKALLAERQWDEAVELLRQASESTEDKLLAVAPRRYVNLRQWCQLQLASLPPEALQLYRARVDPVARLWCERGIAERNPKLLRKVVDQALASSYGDDALMALGDMALESGDYAAARWNWERIVPVPTPQNTMRTWPGYPDTNIDLAAVRARLILTSILEGDKKRAREELSEFVRLHPDARGEGKRGLSPFAGTARRVLRTGTDRRLVGDSPLFPVQGYLDGQEVLYPERLKTLLTESESWPKPKTDADWPTFAGNFQRNRVAESLKDVGVVAWRLPLRPADGAGTKTAGEDPRYPLSFYPLLWNGIVLLNDTQRILAVRLDRGEPAWGNDAIYQSQLSGEAFASIPSDTLGLPRQTMTVFDNKLFARMGSPITVLPQGTTSTFSPGYLVCLDLAAEGRLLWKSLPEDGWSFEGSPVVDDRGVYVAMRRQDVRPQVFAACLDADTGRLRWRRFICGAETPSRGTMHESTHHLLSLSGRTLYYNTNMGAVAAIDAEEGRPLWVSLYPRVHRSNLADPASSHWRRDLTPCLLDAGKVYVAPADSPRIFAFDAVTGQMLWQTGEETGDATQLLGAAGDWLVASGRKLYWIGTTGENQGRVKHVWPDGGDRPGFGRGLLSGDQILWPTRDKLYVFDCASARPLKVVDLTVRKAAGGNLLTAGGRLLIAAETELIAVDPQSAPPNGNTIINRLQSWDNDYVRTR